LVIVTASIAAKAQQQVLVLVTTLPSYVALKQKLTDYFKPELLNRFSSIIVFRSLKLEEIVAIAKLQLNDLAKILGENQGIELRFEDDVVKKIAELGYSPVFGARPLRQVISENIRGVLAEKILRKEIARGNTLRAIIKNNEFQFILE